MRARPPDWWAVIALVAACTTTPTPGPTTPQTQPAPHVTPAATPVLTHRPSSSTPPFEPAPPVTQIGDLPVVDLGRISTTTTLAGIRLTLSISQPWIAGRNERDVTATLENLGRRPVRWLPEGCALPLDVRAELPFAWTYGQAQQSPYVVFKEWLLGAALPTEKFPIRLDIDSDCADLEPDELAPGQVAHGRYRVHATTSFYSQLCPHAVTEAWQPPAGPVELVASFALWARGDEDIEPGTSPTVEARLPIEIREARDMAIISPGQAIDVALASAELRDILRLHAQIDQLSSTYLSLDENTRRWTLLVSYPDAAEDIEGLLVTIDGVAATIIRTERTTGGLDCG